MCLCVSSALRNLGTSISCGMNRTFHPSARLAPSRRRIEIACVCKEFDISHARVPACIQTPTRANTQKTRTHTFTFQNNNPSPRVCVCYFYPPYFFPGSRPGCRRLCNALNCQTVSFRNSLGSAVRANLAAEHARACNNTEARHRACRLLDLHICVTPIRELSVCVCVCEYTFACP